MSTFPPQNVEVVAVAYDPVYDFSMKDGQAVAEPAIDKSSGKVKQRWALHWRRHKGGSNWQYGKVRVYNLHIDRTWGSQSFWDRQDMQGLANAIMAVKSEEPVNLDESIPATVQYKPKGRYYTLLELGNHLQTQVSTPSAPATQQNPELEARVDELEGSVKEILSLVQQLVNQ